MEAIIDLDDEALALAAQELGTTTRSDTVNAALNLVANRRRRRRRPADRRGRRAPWRRGPAHDADFEHISATTGQPHAWIVPRGSLD
jgi:hypothetical protein